MFVYSLTFNLFFFIPLFLPLFLSSSEFVSFFCRPRACSVGDANYFKGQQICEFASFFFQFFPIFIALFNTNPSIRVSYYFCLSETQSRPKTNLFTPHINKQCKRTFKQIQEFSSSNFMTKLY